MTPDRIAALPILALEKSTKNVVIELANGTRFRILGGKSRRPPKEGAAGFTPREMMMVLSAGISEEDFLALIKMREMGLNESIAEITQDGQRGIGNGTPPNIPS